ncbi:MAG TPA: lactoylglutathione lyase [Alphaproteobacteria bacterium]|nr:lactoylglutathione lyase [Alphaproteobacteria bacterium]
MSDTSTKEAVRETADDQNYRLLHTMIRVKDLDKSIDFYCNKLGMSLFRKREFPGGKFTLAFVGYGSEETSAAIELTYNWGQEEAYSHGSGFGHMAVGCRDIYSLCDRLKEEGVSIPRPPGEMMNSGTHIAFIEDPDGYKIELIQRH